MDNRIALNPQHSVIVEACAGSGKTWLLVSRIVRLLLAGVKPDEILAITFTRKAAQEMQARLNEWLHFLATQSDAEVRDFLQAREINTNAENEADQILLARARNLYRDSLLVQPTITINTFHGWFMRILQSAPLNANVPIGMGLLEHTSALEEEAWSAFSNSLQAAPEGEISLFMQALFAGYGLHNTQALLRNFVRKRAEWWSYTSGQISDTQDAVSFAVQQLRDEFAVDDSVDPIAELFAGDALQHAVYDFARALASGTEAQQKHADKLQSAWAVPDIEQRFLALSQCLYTKTDDEPRIFKPTKKQDAAQFKSAHEVLLHTMQGARDAISARAILRFNEAALCCGAALLQHYQDLKLRQQQMDFVDVEWQVCHLLHQSDFAEYMQYKLDSRYSHVLLDEFQDTNPLQWQILQAWFAAADAAESRPIVFVVGDPKQSIYRFRRADARLFGEVSEWLQQKFGAHYLSQNVTRRNSPAILQVVNKVFEQHASEPQTGGFVNFETHQAHHGDLPGLVDILPLLTLSDKSGNDQSGNDQSGDEKSGNAEAINLQLRNPLSTARQEKNGNDRALEAAQFAQKIAAIVAHWHVQGSDGKPRPAEYSDIMVLVRKRSHLRIYEQALRQRHIPFLTSRRGGLLDTLEALDMQALLTFLITPFADLELAQTLRSPLFACADTDLMRLAAVHITAAQETAGDDQAKKYSWWQRLQYLSVQKNASAELLRAHQLLSNWLALADKLPVHDLLDRIYFEGDLVHRYVAALPADLHETVRANLQALLEIALNVDAGRYPSLPRFLMELKELRRASDSEAPDEGRVGKVGNALRIYTIHEAKGLEAPIVWLLDANDTRRNPDHYNVLLDWPTTATHPVHFSLYADKRDALRAHYFLADEEYAQREEMNLLYVAMTRAKQAFLVSGQGELNDASWYARIAAAVENNDNPLLAPSDIREIYSDKKRVVVDSVLLHPLPTGQRVQRAIDEHHAVSAQQHGIWLHALLRHLTPAENAISNIEMAAAKKSLLQKMCAIPDNKIDMLWQQAQRILAQAELQKFFAPQHYLTALNELPYINAQGELRRIDRLVEFEKEVWVLDYKTDAANNPAPYTAQMQDYRSAMQAIYVGKTVRCGLLFAGGTLHEVG